MSDILCPSCSKPTNDGLLCDPCSDRCVKHLRSIRRLWPALEDAVVKLRRVGSGGARTETSPLPLAERAMKVRDYVRNQLGSWVRELDLGDTATIEHGCWCEPYRPCKGWREVPLADDPRVWCEWLIARGQRIRGHAASNEITAEFDYCSGLVLSVVDLPADRIYCGQCAVCNEGLMAKPGAVVVICRKCEVAGIATYPIDVKTTRAAMLAKVEGMLLTRDEVLTAVPSMFGIKINRGTLGSWISRKRLMLSPDGRLRVADVLDLAHGEAVRSA